MKLDTATFTWFVSLHESAHVTCAYLTGLKVRWSTIDSTNLKSGGSGGTLVGMRDDDRRPREQLATAHVITALASVLLYPGTSAGHNADADLRDALELCRDYGLDRDLLTDLTRELVNSEAYRKGELAVADELRVSRWVSGTRLHALLDDELMKFSNEIYARRQGIVDAVERDALFIAARLVARGSERELLAKLAALEHNV